MAHSTCFNVLSRIEFQKAFSSTAVKKVTPKGSKNSWSQYTSKYNKKKKHLKKMYKDVGMGVPKSIKTRCVDGSTQQGRYDGI